MVARILGVERALAIADARDEGAASLLAENVAVGTAGTLEGVFDDLGKFHRHAAEEAVARALDFVSGECAALSRGAARGGIATALRLVRRARSASVIARLAGKAS